jgi:hypothetical protein
MRATRLAFLASVLVIPFVYLACGDDDSAGTKPTGDAGVPPQPQPLPPPVNPPPPPPPDGGDGGGIHRGPESMNFDPSGNGDPISMYWDDAKAMLFIADNKNNQLWSWTDAAGFAKLVKIKDDPIADDGGRTNLGQIVELADGTLVVPRFGFNAVSAIVYVNPTSGASDTVPGVDPTLKRTALTRSPDNRLWGGYFAQPGDGKGTVTMVQLDAGEVPYAGGFEKPVGVLVVGGNLLVSEQVKLGGMIYSLPLDGGFVDGGPYDVFAAVPSTDALTEGPNGSVFTGQFKPLSDGGPLQIRQVWPDGGVDTPYPDAGLSKPQCVAYDKTNKRLFVCDSNGTTVRTIKIFPVN